MAREMLFVAFIFPYAVKPRTKYLLYDQFIT